MGYLPTAFKETTTQPHTFGAKSNGMAQIPPTQAHITVD